LRLMKEIQHPFILPTVDIDFLKDGKELVVFRSLCSKGSIKDVLYDCSNPLDAYEKKYRISKNASAGSVIGRPLSGLERIAKLGKQVLEALQYLSIHRISFTALHSANVLLDESGNARLTDYENDFIGASTNSPERAAFTRHVFARTNVSGYHIEPMAFAFGCLLFEMSVGYEIDSKEFPSDIHPKIKQVLSRIFSEPITEDITLKALLTCPLFSDVKLYSDWIPKEIPLDAKSKQLLEMVSRETFENLMCDDHEREKKTAQKRKSKRLSTALTSKTISAKTNSVIPIATTTTNVTTNTNNKVGTASSSQTASVAVTTDGAVTATEPLAMMMKPATERKDLLSSIEQFNVKKLKKTTINDKSKPLINR